MLRIGRHDLVVTAELETGDDDVATVRRRTGQREVLAGRADQLRDALAEPRS